jgi:hypothetical protein
MSEQLADGGKAKPGASADAGKAVPQIMQPKAAEFGTTANKRPGPLQV